MKIDSGGRKRNPYKTFRELDCLSSPYKLFYLLFFPVGMTFDFLMILDHFTNGMRHRQKRLYGKPQSWFSNSSVCYFSTANAYGSVMID